MMDLRKLATQDFALTLEKYFRPQNPVEDADLLQGRQKQLQQTYMAMAGTGRSIFVWGHRGVGKTSLAVASAQHTLPTAVHAVSVACDKRSTMLGLVETLVDDLLNKNPLDRNAEVKAGVTLGPVAFERSTSKGSWKLTNVNDASRILQAAVESWRERFRGFHPIVIVDEFDQMIPDERKYFGDLIKQIGDRRMRLTMLFCGVAESFDDLLAGHESAFRYIESVHLERLYLDDTMKVVETGAAALGLEIHPDHVLRAGQISDGFPHFAHLLGSSMLWEWFSDETARKKIEPRHFEAGIGRAVASTEKKLADLYHLATRNFTAGWDYFLWAAADHHQLVQPAASIYASYCRIVREAIALKQARPGSRLPEITSQAEKQQDPFDRARFNRRLSYLREARHGKVLVTRRPGWYQFSVPMLRGYCRLIAQGYGISLGTEYGGVSRPYVTE